MRSAPPEQNRMGHYTYPKLFRPEMYKITN